MNDLAKNLLLWVVVAAVLMVVFQSFSPKLAASQEVVYSQFVQEVDNDRIKKVDISSNERTVTFERTDGSKGTTTEPVRELLSDGETGRLVPFFDQPALEAALIKGLAGDPEAARMTKAAREVIVNGYDLKTKTLPRLIDWVESFAPGAPRPAGA